VPRTGNRVSKGARAYVYGRDWHTCVYCRRHEHALRRNHRPECLTVDHVIPRRDGGSNGVPNLVTACSTCNTKRGHRRLTKAELARLPVKGETYAAGKLRQAAAEKFPCGKTWGCTRQPGHAPPCWLGQTIPYPDE